MSTKHKAIQQQHKKSRKNRNQDKSEVEHLKGIIREQSKQIRQLEKQLKYFEKREQEDPFDTQYENPEPEVQATRKQPCHSCGKGLFDEFELLGKVYGTCNICGHRERLK